MRSVFLFASFLLPCLYSWAQSGTFAGKLFEYHPAPGQFINDPASGTPGISDGIINGIGNPLSLGAYGGYVILGFNSPVKNDPDNPYGVDFIVYGNGSPTHAEPGIVRVMKDDNNNGLPDDKWYEIAGSARFINGFQSNYSITYFNPGGTNAADVIWSDNQGVTGKVFKNSFHLQPYYPMASFFPEILADSMTYTGSRVTGNVFSENGMYVSRPYNFGYADNIPVKTQFPSGIPDNPYTSDIIEGDGGDAMDISWAIDDNGNYVDLPEIDFVMVYTAVNANAGWLGEISTEIRGLADVVPDKNIRGTHEMIIAPAMPSLIAIHDTISAAGIVFKFGKLVEDETIFWESSNPEILKIVGNNLIALSIGEAEITGRLESNPSTFFIKRITVTEPSAIVFDNRSRFLNEGDSIDLSISLADASGTTVPGPTPTVVVENPGVASVSNFKDGKFTVLAFEAGTTGIKILYPDYHLEVSFTVIVADSTGPVHLFFSLRNGEKTIIPESLHIIRKSDVLRYTDRYQPGFEPSGSFVSLADAIVSVLTGEEFDSEGNSFAFRQDEAGGSGLYLWKIGTNWEFQYGWGGTKKESGYAKTWVAIINNHVFASGFESIEVHENDMISLQLIDDINLPWSLIRINQINERVYPGEEANFHAEQIDIYPSGSNIFQVTGPFPAANLAIITDRAEVDMSSDLLTSYDGDFSLVFNRTGRHEVSVGNAGSLFVDVNFPLGIEGQSHFTLYPNPCGDWLRISNLAGGLVQVSIFSFRGDLQYRYAIQEGSSSFDLEISRLRTGIYIVEVISDGRVMKQKLIKL